MTDGIVRCTTAHGVKRMAILAAIVCVAPLAGGCSTNNSQAQPPLYLANEGAYADRANEQQTAEATDPADLVTPANAQGGWGAYSGARGQAVAPAPVSNVYRGRHSY